MYLMLALNSQSSCLRLTSSVIMRQHSFFFFLFLNWELDPGPRSCCVSTCSLSYILRHFRNFTLRWSVSKCTRLTLNSPCVQSSP